MVLRHPGPEGRNLQSLVRSPLPLDLPFSPASRASAAVAVNGVSCAIHHGADTEELAYETFLDALFTGDVTISH